MKIQSALYLELIGDVIDDGCLGDHLSIQIVGNTQLEHGIPLCISPTSFLPTYLSKGVILDTN